MNKSKSIIAENSAIINKNQIFYGMVPVKVVLFKTIPVL
jgi:hypothetical protein